MKQRKESDLLHRAAAYCSTSERCVFDVRKKIALAGGTQESIERIITYLQKENFLDENRYCRSYTNDKLKFNQWGRIRIKYELQKKEIPNLLINEALEAIDEKQYMETLAELLKNKKRIIHGKTTQDIYHKLYRFAANRGFESEPIKKCLQPLLKEINESDDLEEFN